MKLTILRISKEEIDSYSINNQASIHITVDEKIFDRTTAIKEMGVSTYDAMHIACAEKAQADILLSTDNKLVNKASRYKDSLFVKVRNPLIWIQEELES